MADRFEVESEIVGVAGAAWGVMLSVSQATRGEVPLEPSLKPTLISVVAPLEKEVAYLVQISPFPFAPLVENFCTIVQALGLASKS
jgi:hypothetical protein